MDFKQRRDSTPGPGRNIFLCNTPYDKIYQTNEVFLNKNDLGQIIIVDSGCPRSLMGKSEYNILREKLKVKTECINNLEKFKFGPSKIYNSERKAHMKLNLGGAVVEVEFFIVDGEVPILLGNDVLDPLKANINLGSRKLEFHCLGTSIDMVRTAGGHYVIPMKDVARAPEREYLEDEDGHLRDHHARGLRQ